MAASRSVRKAAIHFLMSQRQNYIPKCGGGGRICPRKAIRPIKSVNAGEPPQSPARDHVEVVLRSVIEQDTGCCLKNNQLQEYVEHAR
ncbi:hypothetical protein KIN20_036951 [Parelaphostrongylus tenuis]|uniref:Uncharacterized protein n=1 Tax=Parelaphostrongylus tenuis TaxID=148309 RepID=A0AAD5RDP7_PARTN|nr:hypothetical protein KIN20_033376 [Parelaphostrongylus tenuis]KAJ1374292.1 hypothetical protein KIN20_036951 [Parelaphostrongylus tenuis]